jgi:hypothetical protein
LIMI